MLSHDNLRCEEVKWEDHRCPQNGKNGSTRKESLKNRAYVVIERCAGKVEVLRDITENKRMEQELLKSKRLALRECCTISYARYVSLSISCVTL